MFKVNEIKSWAKNKGFVVKKREEGYVWFLQTESESVMTPEPIENVVKQIFNKTTDNKFLDHQLNYKPLKGI